MKKRFFIISFLLLSAFVHAQTDSARKFNWPDAFSFEDSTNIRLHPNPARDNVFISVKDWDVNARYTLMLKDNKGRPVKNLILLQPQQLIPLKNSYGKGVLWTEVWKEKELIGRVRLVIR